LDYSYDWDYSGNVLKGSNIYVGNTSFVSVERGRLITNQILSKSTRQLMCLQLNTVDLQFMLYILLTCLQGVEKVGGFRHVLCVKPASHLNRVLVYVVLMTSSFVFLLLS